jgi:hypothetical protein
MAVRQVPRERATAGDPASPGEAQIAVDQRADFAADTGALDVDDELEADAA